MSSLIDTLKSRTTELAAKTRDRGIDVLGKVRDGTLDWHRTLEARRAEIDSTTAPKWFQLGGLQIFVINRFDHALNVFSDKIREEIARLQQLELEASGQSAEKPAAEALAAEAAPAKARAKATPPKKRASAKAKAAPKAKPALKSKAAPKAAQKAAPKAAPKPRKSRPAAKRPGGKAATRRFIMPIASYDELTAKEVISEVSRLTAAQCKTVRAHEASHKKRKTVLAALDARLAS